MQLFVDDKSSISLAKNPIAHVRSKRPKFRFLRDQVNNGTMEMVYYHTEMQAVDVLTKPVKGDRFKELRRMLGVIALELVN